MKKLFVVFAMLLFNLVTFGQSISIDKVENGTRYIITSKELCRSFSDKILFSFGMSAIVVHNDTILNLDLKLVSNNALVSDKGSHLLIKTFNGNVIELVSTIDTSDRIGQLNSAGGYTYQTYSILPSYSITPEQIEVISKEGISKIRVETETDNIDKDFKKDKAGKVLSADYKLITSAMSSQKDFKDGF